MAMSPVTNFLEFHVDFKIVQCHLSILRKGNIDRLLYYISRCKDYIETYKCYRLYLITLLMYFVRKIRLIHERWFDEIQKKIEKKISPVTIFKTFLSILKCQMSPVTLSNLRVKGHTCGGRVLNGPFMCVRADRMAPCRNALCGP